MSRSAAKAPTNRRLSEKPERRFRLRDHLGAWGRRTAELSVLVAAVVGLVVLGRWTHSYVTTSPHFAVDRAEVTGNDHVPAETIQALAGLPPGTNIFAVSPSDAARRVEANPWVRSATVRRRLPDRVSIEVTEREAIALVRLGGLFLIDGEGAVFKEVEPGDPTDLPVITGITRERFDDDRGGARVDLSEALALLRLYEESGLTRDHALSEVHVEQEGSLSLFTLEEVTHVRLGRPPFRRKLRRLARLFRELRSEGAVAQYIYLEEGDGEVQPDRAVVRLRP